MFNLNVMPKNCTKTLVLNVCIQKILPGNRTYKPSTLAIALFKSKHLIIKYDCHLQLLICASHLLLKDLRKQNHSLFSQTKVQVQLFFSHFLLYQCPVFGTELKEAYLETWGFLSSSDSKESACNLRDPGLIPGLGRFPGEWNGNPLQYSCLGFPMDRGVWRATVHEVTKSWTQLSNQHFYLKTYLLLNC